MVDAFHQAGIEVWLDVVFNHTAEMDDSGPTEHFKLLGREDWYLQDEQGQLLNYSGCGNTFKCAYSGAPKMIKDSLFFGHTIMEWMDSGSISPVSWNVMQKEIFMTVLEYFGN